jgi:hypothetical protein
MPLRREPRSPSAERRRRAHIRDRHLAAWLGSLLIHAVLLGLFALWPDPPPPPRILELALIRPDEGDEEGVPPPTEAEPEPSPPTQSPVPPTQRPTPRPQPQPTLPPSPEPSPTPLPQPQPAPPQTSFRDWRRSQASAFLPTAEPIGQGGAHGSDLAQDQGRDRCVPAPHRRFDVLFLLFDASGSMTGMGRAQALSCAQQYAQAALDQGAHVIVGTFALDTIWAPPTRRLMDIQAALRAAIDARHTALPTREFGALVDQAPGAVAELVVVSDGWFVADTEVLIWYRYFLEANGENRATMYTVGAPGHREAVRRLRSIGFDVFVYEQIRR